MLKRVGVLLAVPALLAAACAPAAPPPGRAYDVQVDAKATPFSIAVNAYFPQEVQAHPGDTIRFTAVDRGEIHTVTFGTLVDAAIAANRPNIRRALPEVAAVLESAGLTPISSGRPPTINQSAAQPCFLETGRPPLGAACAKEQQRQPDFTGTGTFFNSGYLSGGAVFALRLADTIKPGVYGYLCLLHGVDMSGRVVVLERDKPAPSPEDVRARGSGELGRIVRGLQGPVDAAARVPKGTAIAGVFSPDIPGAQATVFAPVELTVGAGESVAWTIFGIHTISFNAPQDAVGTILKESDGSWALNPRALEAVNSPPPPPASAPVTIDSGPWDGRGFRSSGLIVSEGPAIVSYKVTFTQPGTYPFKCLVHTDMEGTVKVGE